MATPTPTKPPQSHSDPTLNPGGAGKKKKMSGEGGKVKKHHSSPLDPPEQQKRKKGKRSDKKASLPPHSLTGSGEKKESRHSSSSLSRANGGATRSKSHKLSTSKSSNNKNSSKSEVAPPSTKSKSSKKDKKKGRFRKWHKKNGRHDKSKDKGDNESADKRKREERKSYVVNCLAELPEDIQKKTKKSKLDPTEVDKNLPYFLNILHFITKHNYKMRGAPDPPHKPRKAYAPIHMMQFAKAQLLKPEKEMKKIFKSIEFVRAGGFGRVFSGKNGSKKRIAIKQLPHITEKDRRANYCEIAFLAKCDHPNIVKYYESWLVKDKVWIITEFLEGGTLHEAVRVHQFSERHIAYVSREILKALRYLHSLNFVHRDLKSGNVMMSIEGQIKLIDFGLCADFTDGPRLQMLGSPFWMPPEMIKKEPHTYKVDIWSFAVCVLEMFNKEPPYPYSRIKAMFVAVCGGMMDAIPSRATKSVRDFLSRCFKVDPEERETADQLLDHPFVNQAQLADGIRDVLRGVFVSNSLTLSGI